MDKVKAQLREQTAILDPYANNIPPFVDAAKALDINSGLILGAVLSVFTVIFMILEGWTILITVLTVIYPALMSMKAIQSKESNDDSVWLSYWMIFGVFHVLETFFGFFFSYIPYWDWIRLAFFLFLILPQTKGTEVLYKNHLKPFLAAHKDQIEDLVQRFKDQASSLEAEAKKAVADAASDPTLLVKGAQLAAKASDALADDKNSDDDDAPKVELAE